MQDRVALSDAVELVIDWAVAGDERYDRGAGRLLGRIVLERGLTLEQARILAGCFEYLPADPDRARTVLMSWARLKQRAR